ncbi:hypothetical protein Ae168Ps1_1234c [Pseudonocardia sp. Ae168_Ps1]|uniref:hypothetical protein n=1 Tax=unclassified Pseudonocardia TaxID=2619320 RepID=UPI00094B033E|nr:MULTISPECIES: hypothetical protein [unclassified Pseudonocardia]OLL72853.1 hypothetical protein Ae150APs1_1231c [Pseudonocardia sp. Ae150A_Ps1]OLL78828.1 hypothetical protein Ae168Ps1_1234c [Pseudonocardia sp. Ae168_Ps1]OLL87046.1 hypothetical protein Ae263Ps1_4101 [Pseudonocardia sp. Ae263_Ps1]OLL92923.1 hypothetical protein Ae356Ps1_2820c [Pseudonocardia sp. Ae356_Ps1]
MTTPNSPQPNPYELAQWQQYQAWQQHQAAARSESARKLAGWAIACGGLGLLVFGIVLGPIAFALGLTAYNQLLPGQRGKNDAVGAMVLGVIDIFAFFVIMAML